LFYKELIQVAMCS